MALVLHAHAVVFTFVARILGGEISIQDQDAIIDISRINIKEADKIIFYFPNGTLSKFRHKMRLIPYSKRDLALVF